MYNGDPGPKPLICSLPSIYIYAFIYMLSSHPYKCLHLYALFHPYICFHLYALFPSIYMPSFICSLPSIYMPSFICSPLNHIGQNLYMLSFHPYICLPLYAFFHPYICLLLYAHPSTI